MLGLVVIETDGSSRCGEVTTRLEDVPILDVDQIATTGPLRCQQSYYQ